MIGRAAVVGRRACAVLAACSAVLHGFSLVHATSVAATVLTVVMLAACLFCARDLWARGTLRAWVLVALMNLAMIASHAPASAAHHHGGSVIAAELAHHSTVMTLATTLAAVEVVVAAAVLYYRTRAVRPTSPDTERTTRRVTHHTAIAEYANGDDKSPIEAPSAV